MAVCRVTVLCFCVVAVVCQGRAVDISITSGRPGVTQRRGGHHDYCNTWPVAGLEGEVVNGYSLKSVHIVMSPGQTDISSHRHVKTLDFPSLDCTLTETYSDKLHTFKHSMIQPYRIRRDHPDLKPFHPTFPEVCSTHHLTGHGFLQVSEVGKHLNTAYLRRLDHKFLKPHYSALHVDSMRTGPSYQSSLVLLHSLLPQQQFEKMRIHLSNRNFCDKSESKISHCDCGKLKELSPFIEEGLTAGKSLFKSVSPDPQIVQQLFQTDSLEDVSSLALLQLLMQYECNNMSAPCDNKKLCFITNEERLSKLHDTAIQHVHSIYTDPLFQKYSKMRSYPFLEQLVSRAGRQSGNQTMFIYMGDQLFLQFLRTSLSVKFNGVTPLASRLIIEVYKKNLGQINGGRVYIKVLHNGDDVTAQVADCWFNMENGLCPLDSLKTLVSMYRTGYLNTC